MARNEEKAQSMLYRFREAQAAELGLGTRSDRRPKMASACKSLRECERWRGEILREISRKVSKIQDAGMTDYEVRDLNDEINKLMREKRHWENQIVALGGANYRRNVAMLDDDGKEVPGTKGYKYFGRAKDLPGVRELFESRKKEEDEENQALAFYKKFMNHGPAYFGDLDEGDGKLLAFEREAEEGEWTEACTHVWTILGIPTSEPHPQFPGSTQSKVISSSSDSPPLPPPNTASAKRKASDQDQDGDTTMSTASSDTRVSDPSSKRSKASISNTSDPSPTATTNSQTVATTSPHLAHAQAAASYIPFLSPEDLLPPKLPTREEMEGVLLRLRKQVLVQEYFGEG
ncbi:hypothetical protein SERLA73DRAFT_179494 [Serpula lacrymans var. lacrymans S7.3]|uniref:Pre-mRNA-splicing factor ISY1 n=2 Tax=Serpula lacrymans var. lacrymans TaxID=341189 RepID=F8PSQ4_SERL3|nr:uncharacterized protein SERLADRAFT_464650 [Serpula lacrymans var. lacrymans S7.9]EGO01332.1 hypothetical protein SERLA73DRAFT_179494 [Serpula lacrymans var. lacrymans S7.3]EGO26970.1 hypothetical protein SERLADRAFT_464650 [Serpula lacrymans var. lacrymans S7.9]